MNDAVTHVLVPVELQLLVQLFSIEVFVSVLLVILVIHFQVVLQYRSYQLYKISQVILVHRIRVEQTPFAKHEIMPLLVSAYRNTLEIPTPDVDQNACKTVTVTDERLALIRNVVMFVYREFVASIAFVRLTITILHAIASPDTLEILWLHVINHHLFNKNQLILVKTIFVDLTVFVEL